MKKKPILKKKSNTIPKYDIGGMTYGTDIKNQLAKVNYADEDKSALSYGVGSAMQGLSTGAGLGSIGGTTGSLIMGGVGLVGGFLDGVINGKKDAVEENREKRKGIIDMMQANMYSGSSGTINPMGQTTQFPYGGIVPQPNAEVEGGEVLKQPNGQVNTMQGPSHAQGGIDVNAPQGTKVYSDRIKHKVGNKYETYAETAAKLNKILDKYKKVDKNEDTLKKNSDALMIARIQQKLDNLFDEQEMQKTAQGIEQPQATMPQEQMSEEEQASTIGGEGAPEMFKKGGWIQTAINPAHKGYCTPMTKPTCTGHRKALAMRFKHGDLHKHAYGGVIPEDGNPIGTGVKKLTNFEQRFNAPEYTSTYNTLYNTDGTASTHKMMSFESDGKYYAAPTIIQSNGQLKELSIKDAQDYAMKNKEYVRFNTSEEARNYAEGGYKKGTRLEQKADGGIIEEPWNKEQNQFVSSELNPQTTNFFRQPTQQLMMNQKGPYNEKLMMEQRQIKNRQLMMDQTGPYYQKLMMDQTKRQINPSQLKFAYGGTTGWPLTYGQNLQDELSVPEEETDNIELSTYNNDLNFNIPKNKIYFTGQNTNLPNNSSLNTAYNTGIMPTTTNKGFTPKYPGITGNYGKFMMFPNNKGLDFDPNNPLNYNPQPGRSFNANVETEQTQATGAGVGDAGAIETEEQKKAREKEERRSRAGNAIYGLVQAAPMVYNLLQKRPDQMPTAPYMNTNVLKPERMDMSQDLREAERTYSAIINNQSLPASQRILAARQLQATKNQIMAQQNNQYKQDINRTEEANSNIRQRNIETAMKIKDVNDANIAAYANMRSQAVGDLSQLAQKTRLESNMRENNTKMMKALNSAFPDYTFKNDGTILQKDGKPLTAEQMAYVSNYINTLNSYNNIGGPGYLNGSTGYYQTNQYFNPNYGKPTKPE